MRGNKQSRAIGSMVVFMVFFLGVTLAAAGAKGWKDIKPKKHLKEWSIHPIPATAALSPQSQWSIDRKTGFLVCSGKGGHDWLRYDRRQWRDFILQVEWRFLKLDSPAKYNSGIFVRNSADAGLWHQAQTGDASGGFLFGVTPTGEKNERFNTRDKAKNLVKPAGEWNQFELECVGKTITLRVNGEVSVVWDQCGVAEGYVGLEAEGYAIEFRTIRIREVKP